MKSIRNCPTLRPLMRRHEKPAVISPRRDTKSCRHPSRSSLSSTGRWLLVLSVLLASVELCGESTWVSGTVFLDENNDGIRQAGEAGLAGVLVSNGEDVVATDGEGRYHLQVRPRSAIFVIKPPEYRLPQGPHNLPVFYHLHWPEGSGELRYGGIPPTGPLPESLDFPLLPGDQGNAFSVLLVADPQVHNRDHVDYYEKRFIEELENDARHRFGIMLGDIVRNDLSLFEPYLPVNARLPGPIFHVVGNHDIDYDAPCLITAPATFQRQFGPPNYALMEGDALFIVLNNVFTPLPGEPVAGGRYAGGLTPMAEAFVANLLRHVPREHLVVLSQHIPFIPGFARPQSHRPDDQKSLLTLLRDRRVLVLAGHTHTQWHSFLGEESGWRGSIPLRQWVVGTASGSWWGGEPGPDGLPDSMMKDGTPPGYGILHLDGTDYRIEYRVAGEAPDYQFRSLVPRHVVAGERDQPMQVNVFNGSEHTRVDYRIEQKRDWTPLSQVRSIDYTYAARLARRNLSETPSPGTHLPPPIVTDHLWEARLPRNLPPGDYQVEIRVTDEWGAEFRESKPLTVRPATLPYGRN